MFLYTPTNYSFSAGLLCTQSCKTNRVRFSPLCFLCQVASFLDPIPCQIPTYTGPFHPSSLVLEDLWLPFYPNIVFKMIPLFSSTPIFIKANKLCFHLHIFVALELHSWSFVIHCNFNSILAKKDAVVVRMGWVEDYGPELSQWRRLSSFLKAMQTSWNAPSQGPHLANLRPQRVSWKMTWCHLAT